jgi:ferredoxin
MAEAGSDKWMIEIAGVDGTFTCPDGQSLLSAMINNGRSCIKVGCRNGGCGVCRVRIIQGDYQCQKMTRSRISEQDEAQGIVLACRVLPGSDLALEPMPLELRGGLA